MICVEARERMLEAGQPELEGADGSGLARHIRNCPDCRAVASRILVEEEALRSALHSTPSVPVEELLAGLRDTPRRARTWGWTVPAAAAAVAAGMLLSGPFDPVERVDVAPEGPSLAIAAPRAPLPRPVVDAGDREVAVFTTSNPNITVAWIYQEPIQ